MNMDIKTYCEKIRGCFLGKNIGGTLGAPFEGKRGVLDVDYYTHDLSLGVLPNDDLDLQLVWLIASERYGRAVNAEILAQYWLNFIVADWSEYGNGKNNLRGGLPIGQSNRHKNWFKDSCGSFIRSEIWACLAPGRPEIATKYAFEDAIIDHADEGLYGEIFMAAVESAAFVEKDIRKLIDIGLSYIPEDSAVAGVIHLALNCYDEGLTWKEARKKILIEYNSGFGLHLEQYITPKDDDIPEGSWGFDAPANVGITVMAAIYGEGDFSKAVCIAAGCMEDSDCTAGAVGATYGIMYGPDCIDEKWLVPIGDTIKTISIDQTKVSENVKRFPKTVTELSNRIIRLMPSFMNEHFDPVTGTIEAGDDLYDDKKRSPLYHRLTNCERLKLRGSGIFKSNCLAEVILVPEGGYGIEEGSEKKFTMHFKNMLVNQQWLTIKIDFPEEWQTRCREVSYAMFSSMTNLYETQDIKFIPQNLTKNRYDIPVTISFVGRNTEIHTKIVFFADLL